MQATETNDEIIIIFDDLKNDEVTDQMDVKSGVKVCIAMRAIAKDGHIMSQDEYDAHKADAKSFIRNCVSEKRTNFTLPIPSSSEHRIYLMKYQKSLGWSKDEVIEQCKNFERCPCRQLEMSLPLDQE